MANRFWFHFLGPDCRLANGDGRLVEEGEEYRLPPGERAKLCRRGFHGCRTALAALRAARARNIEATYLDLRKLLPRDDDTIVEKCGKAVAPGFRCIALVDARPVLWAFAADWLEKMLWGAGLAVEMPPDQGSLAVVGLLRRRAAGENVPADEVRRIHDAAHFASDDAHAAARAAAFSSDPALRAILTASTAADLATKLAHLTANLAYLAAYYAYFATTDFIADFTADLDAADEVERAMDADLTARLLAAAGVEETGDGIA